MHPYLLQGLCYLAFEAHREHWEETHCWEPLTAREREEVAHTARQVFSLVCARIGKRIARRVWPKEPEADLLLRLARALSPRRGAPLEPELREHLWNEGLLVSPHGRPCELFVSCISHGSERTTAGVTAPVTPTPPLAVVPGRVRLRASTGEWRIVRLSPLEYRLLAALKHAAGTEVSREALMDAGWNEPVSLSTFSQRLHQLRRKLRDVLGDDCIENTYGSGYRLNDLQERILLE